MLSRGAIAAAVAAAAGLAVAAAWVLREWERWEQIVRESEERLYG